MPPSGTSRWSCNWAIPAAGRRFSPRPIPESPRPWARQRAWYHPPCAGARRRLYPNSPNRKCSAITCTSATAAAAGLKVVTLQLEENGYPSLAALKAAVSDRTAALLIGNPDDMGIYNPEIREWTRIVHAAGGLCFYDHANFNGVMGKL